MGTNQINFELEQSVKIVSVAELKSTSKNELSLARFEKCLAEMKNFAVALENCVSRMDEIEKRISKQVDHSMEL